MDRDYRDALDELQFSPEAKQRLARAVAAAGVEGGSEDASGSARGRRRRYALVAAAAATLALVAGCTAYATGFVKHDAAPAAASLPKTAVVDGVGHPETRVSADGLTVTAQAVVGDGSDYAIVFDIEKDDGTAFEGIRENDDGTLALRFGNLATVTIEDAPSRGTVSYFVDADPSDNAIQFVKASTIDPRSGAEYVGKPVHVKLLDLMAIEADGSERTLVEGAWRMDFLADCDDASKSLPAGQTFAFDEGTARMRAVAISPLSLSIDLVIDFPIAFDPTGAGSEQSRYLAELPLAIHFEDGTVLDASRGGTSIAIGQNATTCSTHMLFDRVIDLDSVVSVTVGDVEIPMP